MAPRTPVAAGIAGVVLGLWLGRPELARAQAVEIDHLQLALTSGEFLGVEGTAAERPWSYRFATAYRYVHRPLVADIGGQAGMPLVDGRSVIDVAAGVALGRSFGIGLDLPILVDQSGYMGSSGAALGDLRVALRGDVFHTARGFGGALAVGYRAPTGSTSLFLGEGSWGALEPRAMVGWHGGPGDRIRVALNVGARFRQTTSFADLRVGNELVAALGFGVRPIPSLDLFAELHAQTALSSAIFSTAQTPVEVLAGFGSGARGVDARAAIGFGVVEGYGSPKARLIVSLSYSPPARAPAMPPALPAAAPLPVEKTTDPAIDPEPPIEIPVADSDPPEVDEEPRVTVGERLLVLAEPIYFDINSRRIRARFRGELDELARAITRRPWIGVVWIEGHADRSGPSRWNQRLSELRAETVKRALVERGVDATRLRTLALGRAQPDAPTGALSGHARHRRVNFHIRPEPPPPPAEPTPTSAGPSAAAEPVRDEP